MPIKINKLILPFQMARNVTITQIALLLAACGGTKTKLSNNSSNTETENTEHSGTVINTVGLNNSQNLSYFSSPELNIINSSYSLPEAGAVTTVNQSYSESYISSWKGIVSNKEMPSNKNIAGLMYPHPSKSETTDEIWKSDGEYSYVSFSFFDPYRLLLDEEAYTNSDGTYPEIYNHSEFATFTLDQQNSVRSALFEFEKVANIKFVEVQETGNQVGTIRFGISTVDFTATASRPGDYWADNGDIWLSQEYIKEHGTVQGESRVFSSFLHEIGHAMGLSHPHDNILLENDIDFRHYTQMSYEHPDWAYFGSGADKIYTVSNTLMVYDIQALQYLYGSNSSYNSDDTKYEINPANLTVMAIWDAGGEDLIDLSSFNHSCIVDLNHGSYSTLGYHSWEPKDNLGIAFNTFIENISGSQADDVIVGNELDNEISGNDGDDTLHGGAGNDIFNFPVDSRYGVDKMYGGDGNDTYFLLNASDTVIEFAGEGIDTVYSATNYALPENVENLHGFATRGNLTLEGNSLDNVISGSKLDDIISGKAGADDFLLYLGMGNDKITDFNSYEGDEILLAESLTAYDYSNTSTGAMYNLTDGSSLELIYVI